MSERQIFFKEVRAVQAIDLPKFEVDHHTAGHGNVVARIDGAWRELLDVYDSSEQMATLLSMPKAREMRDMLGYDSPCWVVVRYVVEERSTSVEIWDDLHAFRTSELVEVQIPTAAFLQDAP